MATLAAIHTALKDRLETIAGLRVSDVPAQGLTPPYAFPVLTGGEPVAFGRLTTHTWHFEVVVVTAQTVRPRDGYLALMEYADISGTNSVRLAIWDGNDLAAGTFGGLARTQARPAEWREFGVDGFDAYQGYGGVFDVEVITTN